MATKSSLESVTHSQSFAAIIKEVNGEKKLVLKSQLYFRNQLQKFKVGDEVTLVVNDRKPQRSLAQNSYYWGVYLPLIAEQTGERNLDRLHELFKGLFLTSGVVQVLGKPVRMKRSTTGLNKVEFGLYITAIENETGIAAPPTENSF